MLELARAVEFKGEWLHGGDRMRWRSKYVPKAFKYWFCFETYAKCLCHQERSHSSGFSSWPSRTACFHISELVLYLNLDIQTISKHMFFVSSYFLWNCRLQSTLGYCNVPGFDVSIVILRYRHQSPYIQCLKYHAGNLSQCFRIWCAYCHTSILSPHMQCAKYHAGNL